MAVDIYTNAPPQYDAPGSQESGKLGSLRVVAVDGATINALFQLSGYKDRGFFATVHRSDALAFVADKETLERRIDAAIQEKRPEQRDAEH